MVKQYFDADSEDALRQLRNVVYFTVERHGRNGSTRIMHALFYRDWHDDLRRAAYVPYAKEDRFRQVLGVLAQNAFSAYDNVLVVPKSRADAEVLKGQFCGGLELSLARPKDRCKAVRLCPQTL
jgi:hypothetical protein